MIKVLSALIVLLLSFSFNSWAMSEDQVLANAEDLKEILYENRHLEFCNALIEEYKYAFESKKLTYRIMIREHCPREIYNYIFKF